MKHKKMILRRAVPDRIESGRWVDRFEEFEVVVLSIVDNYAMVKRPRCLPFVVHAKELSPNAAHEQTADNQQGDHEDEQRN